MANDLGTDPVQFLRDHDKMLSPRGENATALRVLRYPAIDLSADDGKHTAFVTRCGVHTDYGGLTLLYQDACGGLEVQGMDGEWVPATPIPGTIVVNIGDLMAFWSGGRYKATKHRVRFVAKQGEGRQPPWSKDRYSIVLFSHPNSNTKVVPLGTKGEAEGEEGLTAGQHVQKRFQETYTQ